MKRNNPLNDTGKALYKRLFHPGIETSLLQAYCYAAQNLESVQQIINTTPPLDLPQKIATQWKTYTSAMNQLSVKLGLDQSYPDMEQGEDTAIAKMVGGK